jgi:hypothetical protein
MCQQLTCISCAPGPRKIRSTPCTTQAKTRISPQHTYKFDLQPLPLHNLQGALPASVYTVRYVLQVAQPTLALLAGSIKPPAPQELPQEAFVSASRGTAQTQPAPAAATSVPSVSSGPGLIFDIQVWKTVTVLKDVMMTGKTLASILKSSWQQCSKFGCPCPVRLSPT